MPLPFGLLTLKRTLIYLEAPQRQSVKFNNYSPCASVSVDFKILTETRNESNLILIYKVFNNFVDIDTSNIPFP